MSKEGLNLVFSYYRSKSAMARAVGVSCASVCEWFRKGEIPPDRAIEFERILDIPREKIRPDYFARARSWSNRKKDLP